MKFNFIFNKYFSTKLICESKDMTNVHGTLDPFKDPNLPLPIPSNTRLPVNNTGTPGVPKSGTTEPAAEGQKDGQSCAEGGAKDGNTTDGPAAPGEEKQ